MFRMRRDSNGNEMTRAQIPFVFGSATSKAAAESIEKDTNRLRKLVFEEIRDAGSCGLTCDEVEARLDLRHQTASARVRELALAGQIIDSELKRKTRSGRAAVVWVVV
jgi:hypothetical protein